MSSSIETSGERYRGSIDGRAKPQPLARGIVVALIGPDGVGKSSQTARLTSLFRQNFNCTAVYLGSGDGGWRLRKLAKRQFRKWRGGAPQAGSEAKDRKTQKEYGTNHSVWTALSGLVAAFERYVSLRRALRLARSGSVVICDRWPQNMLPGLFDGPLRLDPEAPWIVQQMSRFERSVYRRMAMYRPDVTIHLVSDFDVSNARKPGDRTRADFNQRLALMQEMRRLDPTVVTVDASRGFDEVTKDLQGQIIGVLEAAV